MSGKKFYGQKPHAKKFQQLALKVGEDYKHKKLDDFLASSLEPKGFSKAMIRKIFYAGKIYVNGRQGVNLGQALKGSEVIDVYFSPEIKEDIQAKAALDVPTVLRVLYEDEAVICFDKPAGIPSHATLDKDRINVYDLSKAQLKGAYLGMHHRLDRDTSGVIFFTKDKKYNTSMSEEFSSHRCTKIYVAVVHGRMKNKSGRIESFLDVKETVGKEKIKKHGSVKKGGKKAISEYSVLVAGKKYSLVEVNIKTGRTHQIRVHLSELGYPIVGDTLYGSPVEEFNVHGRFFLHAHALTINHPVTENAIRIESAVPPLFRELVERAL